MKKVKVFTTSDCQHCDKVKDYLNAKSIDFEEVDLTADKNEAASLVEKTGYSVVPQIQINDKFIVGFDRKKIDEILEKN